jgi:DNA modification methylase
MDEVIKQETGEGWAFYNGDCCEVIRGIPDESIHMSVFSPPFASLYTYSNSDRDMGNCQTHEQFFEHFNFLVPELLRVIMPGRICAVHCMNLPTSKERDGFIGIRDFRGQLIRSFVDQGWVYHSEVCIWKDPVTAMQRTKALGLLHKQLKKDACMSRQGIPDTLLVFRKPGQNPEPVTNTNETFPVAMWQRYASPVWATFHDDGSFTEDIRATETLQSMAEEKDERHICPLQLDVIERAVRLWSNEGDTVLSPFGGIASEGYQSLIMGRRFVGIELKEAYWMQGCKNLRRAEVRVAEKGLFA